MTQDLLYQVVLTWQEAEQRWIAEAPDLPECQATGRHAAAALVALQEALSSWITQAHAEGHPIPQPQKRPLKTERNHVIAAAKAAGRADANTPGTRHDVGSLVGMSYEQAMLRLWNEPIETDNTQALVELLAHAYQEGYQEVAQEQGWTLAE